MENAIIEINTDHLEPLEAGDDLFVNRTAVVDAHSQNAEISISVQAFNRLDKTKRCIESILEYTKTVDYELLLIDNGSTDGTLEYFKSVPHEKKRIFHITKNIGAGYPSTIFGLADLGKFVCTLTNDLIVTPHWLDNMLTCIKSDPKIGMVNPMSNNVSNFQNVDFPYKNYEEMQQKAAEMNHSDPRKWEDRQRLITLGTLYRKEVFLAKGWPLSDTGFFHDFGDDDITFAVRRMGYRTVMAGDTWICHDHDVYHGEGKDKNQFLHSLSVGKANFIDKYFGVDAWVDANNYYIGHLRRFPAPKAKKSARILGVDTRCGTPILDVKNWLRKSSIFDTELSAFTQDPKYWLDLKTICTGSVICDREEFISDAYPKEYFDYVIADRPLNRYHEPQKIINDLFALCKKGGIVSCKLKNAFSFQEYAYLLGQWGVYDREFSYNIPLDAFNTALNNYGTVKDIICIPFLLDDDTHQTINSLIPAELPDSQRSEVLTRIVCEEYLFVVEKS